MIVVDRRVGSRELSGPLRELGVPIKVEELEFGDATFVMRGPEQRPVLVGIERKAPGDLIESLASGRLTGHQVPGLVQCYELVWLVVEGIPQALPDGGLKFGHSRACRNWKYSRLLGQLFTLELRVGLRVAMTSNLRGTAAWLAALHSWGTESTWEEHRSHLHRQQIEAPSDPYNRDSFLEYKMRVAKSLAEGVGWERAKAAAAHFESVHQMVVADSSEWRKVEGFGKKLAERVVEETRRLK
jgi:ERCC4-type nuclease